MNEQNYPDMTIADLKSNIVVFKNNHSDLTNPVFNNLLVVLIEKRNNKEITRDEAAELLGIKKEALGRLISKSGYHWDISSKSYIRNSKTSNSFKKKDVKKPKKISIVFEPEIYNILKGISIIENKSISEVLSLLVSKAQQKEYPLLQNAVISTRAITIKSTRLHDS